MGQSRRRFESGQALSEYAVIMALIAIACLVAVLVLGFGIKGQFESSAPPKSDAPFVPPTTTQTSFPTTLQDCEDEGWRNYPQFEDEEACKRFVDGRAP